MPETIPLSQPDITDDDIDHVTETLRAGGLDATAKVELFEEVVAAEVNRTDAVAVNSGASALQIALTALEIGAEDEVLTSAFNCVSSANAVLHVGARPVFVDCEPRTLNLCPRQIERRITERTRAIVASDVFGNPAALDDLEVVANRFELPLIEYAIDGLGAALITAKGRRRPAGSFGRVSIFDFDPSRIVTAGQGGIIVTDDHRLAETCRMLRDHGRPPARPSSEGGGTPTIDPRLVHESPGHDFRLSEINAALGITQVKRLEKIVRRRQSIAAAYTRRLMAHPDIMVPTVDENTVMSWPMYVVRITDRFSEGDRDTILAGLRRHDVGCGNHYPPIPMLPFYRSRFGYGPGDFPMTESVSHRTIALPMFNRLTDREIDLVCQTLELMIKRLTFSRT